MPVWVQCPDFAKVWESLWVPAASLLGVLPGTLPAKGLLSARPGASWGQDELKSARCHQVASAHPAAARSRTAQLGVEGVEAGAQPYRTHVLLGDSGVHVGGGGRRPRSLVGGQVGGTVRAGVRCGVERGRGKEGAKVILIDLPAAQRGKPRPKERDQVCSFPRGAEPGLSQLKGCLKAAPVSTSCLLQAYHTLKSGRGRPTHSPEETAVLSARRPWRSE